MIVGKEQMIESHFDFDVDVDWLFECPVLFGQTAAMRCETTLSARTDEGIIELSGE